MNKDYGKQNTLTTFYSENWTSLREDEKLNITSKANKLFKGTVEILHT